LRRPQEREEEEEVVSLVDFVGRVRVPGRRVRSRVKTGRYILRVLGCH